MGYAFGANHKGREIGYGVQATCDEPGCEAKIDRGLAYCCGGIDAVGSEDATGCGDYFCGSHLFFNSGSSGYMLCSRCTKKAECPECEGEGETDDGECVTCAGEGYVTRV